MTLFYVQHLQRWLTNLYLWTHMSKPTTGFLKLNKTVTELIFLPRTLPSLDFPISIYCTTNISQFWSLSYLCMFPSMLLSPSSNQLQSIVNTNFVVNRNTNFASKIFLCLQNFLLLSIGYQKKFCGLFKKGPRIQNSLQHVANSYF